MRSPTTSTARLSGLIPQQRVAPARDVDAPLAQPRPDRPVEAGRLAVAILRHIADSDDQVAMALQASGRDPLDDLSDARPSVIEILVDLRIHIEDHHGRVARRPSCSTVARLAALHRDWICEQLGIPTAVA